MKTNYIVAIFVLVLIIILVNAETVNTLVVDHLKNYHNITWNSNVSETEGYRVMAVRTPSLYEDEHGIESFTAPETGEYSDNLVASVIDPDVLASHQKNIDDNPSSARLMPSVEVLNPNAAAFAFRPFIDMNEQPASLGGPLSVVTEFS